MKKFLILAVFLLPFSSYAVGYDNVPEGTRQALIKLLMIQATAVQNEINQLIAEQSNPTIVSVPTPPLVQDSTKPEAIYDKPAFTVVNPDPDTLLVNGVSQSPIESPLSYIGFYGTNLSDMGDTSGMRIYVQTKDCALPGSRSRGIITKDCPWLILTSAAPDGTNIVGYLGGITPYSISDSSGNVTKSYTFVVMKGGSGTVRSIVLVPAL